MLDLSLYADIAFEESPGNGTQNLTVIPMLLFITVHFIVWIVVLKCWWAKNVHWEGTNQWMNSHLLRDNMPLLFQAAHVTSEDFPDSVMPVSSCKAHDLHRELEDEVIPSYIEQFERDVQDDIILLGSFSLEQVRVKNYKTILSLAS